MKLLCYVLSTFLIFAPLSVSALAKAPGTAKIVFTSRRDGNSEIYIMNPDGSDQINLTQHHGNELIYDKRVREVGQLFKVALDSGVPQQLTHRGDNGNADWFDPAFALPVSPQPRFSAKLSKTTF